MAAVTQIRHRHSKGRAYYDRKLADPAWWTQTIAFTAVDGRVPAAG